MDKLNTNAGKRFQILSLSGGGYRGLHTAQILENIEREIGGRIAKHFDLIAGTSIGGIIGLALSLEIPAKEIRISLEEIGPKLFGRNPPAFSTIQDLLKRPSAISKLIFTALNWKSLNNDLKYSESSWFNPEPLRSILLSDAFFSAKRMCDLLHPTIIPTVNYSTGLPKFYKTDHFYKFTFDKEIPLVDVALGTSAAPIYFPIYKINNSRIVDGGLIANDPSQVAIHEAMMFFNIRPGLYGDESTGPDDLRVLSIGTLTNKAIADTSKPLNQGLTGWGAGIFELAGSAQEAMAAFMVEHMLPGKMVRIPSLNSRPEKTTGLADSSEAATEKLKAFADSLIQYEFKNKNFTDLFSHKGKTLSEVRIIEEKRKC